jgi:PAS domain S-box-containing protein
MFIPEFSYLNSKKLRYGPLMCWDFYSSYYKRLLRYGEDRKYLQLFLSGKRCQLPADIPVCLQQYDAFVITDAHQVIEWVSSGFYDMTGYTKTEAVNRTPSFLQGSHSDKKSKQCIKRALDKRIPVTMRIINYTKRGDKYNCEINIQPVFLSGNVLTHFLALERKVK